MHKQIRQIGFTIVELLIVVVVIGILAALVVTAWNGITQRAKDSSLASDKAQAKKQIEAFYAVNGSYPTANNCTNTAATEICLKTSPGNTLTYTFNGNTASPPYTLNGVINSTSQSNGSALSFDAEAPGPTTAGGVVTGTCTLNTTAAGGIIVLAHAFGSASTLSLSGSVNGTAMNVLQSPIPAHPYGPSAFAGLLGLNNVSSGTKTVSVTLVNAGSTGRMFFHCYAYKSVGSFGTVISGSNITSLDVPARTSPLVVAITTTIGRSTTTYSLATSGATQRAVQLADIANGYGDYSQIQMADVSNTAAHTWTMTNWYGTSMFAVPLNL